MGPFAYRSWVEISLKQIVENFRAVRQVVGADVEVMPVVKADAYRHGAVEVSRALAAAGARWLAVSNVEEGAILRDRGITHAHSGDGGFPAGRTSRPFGLQPNARDSFTRATLPNGIA